MLHSSHCFFVHSHTFQQSSTSACGHRPEHTSPTHFYITPPGVTAHVGAATKKTGVQGGCPPGGGVLKGFILPGYDHRGSLRGIPGSACPQSEPNATELPSCAPISARAAQRRRGGGGVARKARAARAPKAKSCATSCGTFSVLRNDLRRVVHVLVLHASPKGRRRGGGSRPGRRVPQH